MAPVATSEMLSKQKTPKTVPVAWTETLPKLSASMSDSKLLARQSDSKRLTHAGTLLLGMASKQPDSRPSSGGSTLSTDRSKSTRASTTSSSTRGTRRSSSVSAVGNFTRAGSDDSARPVTALEDITRASIETHSTRGKRSSSATSVGNVSRTGATFMPWKKCPPPYGCGVGLVAQHRPGCHCVKRHGSTPCSRHAGSDVHEIPSSPSYDVQVEADFKVKPVFRRGPSGTFVAEVPGVQVNICTVYNNPSVLTLGRVNCNPSKEFLVTIPKAKRVVFDPKAKTPSQMCFRAYAQKREPLFVMTSQKLLNSTVHNNSGNGGMTLGKVQLEDVGTQDIEDAVLGYRLKVKGELCVEQKGSLDHECHTVYAIFDLEFKCWLQEPMQEREHSADGIFPQQGESALFNASTDTARFLSGGFNIRSLDEPKTQSPNNVTRVISSELEKLENRLSDISRFLWRASREEVQAFKLEVVEIETNARQIEHDEPYLKPAIVDRLHALYLGAQRLSSAIAVKTPFIMELKDFHEPLPGIMDR